MNDIVERAEAALEGVGPGPWEVRDGFIYPLSIRCGLGGIWERDARFIAAARTLVPELIAALKAARAQRDQDLSDFAANYAHMTAELKAARAEIERLRAAMPTCTCPASSLFSGSTGRNCPMHGGVR